MIAGLLHPDAGSVLFGDNDATRLSLRERNVGFVFQHYALFKHMTVAENIAFGLRSRPRARRPDKATIARRVEELLGADPVAGVRRRAIPEQLSGGQRQRVALARALAIDPTVLLLDEPFGALDAKVRVELRRWLRRLHEQTGQTTLFVTHDQEEALELADRVVVLREGRIEQVGTPDEIYSAPASEYVFDFIGRANALEGRVEGGAVPIARACACRCRPTARRRRDARLYVRPHDLALARRDEGWPARVIAALPPGRPHHPGARRRRPGAAAGARFRRPRPTWRRRRRRQHDRGCGLCGIGCIRALTPPLPGRLRRPVRSCT